MDQSLPSPDFREEVIRADAHASLGVARVSLLWPRLTEGFSVAVDAFCSDTRCYMALADVPDRTPVRALTPRKVEILRRTLLGEPQKATALELGLAPSSVASAVTQCLRAMGFDCRALRVPALLVMAAHARGSERRECLVRSSQLENAGRVFEVVSAPRPEPALSRRLSSAEHEIARLIVEGRSNAEIAVRRTTSVHTVANQLARVFHKLGVGSRPGLLCRLIADAQVSSRGIEWAFL
jgi:DNA-binding CsgD family transcriptional regulator